MLLSVRAYAAHRAAKKLPGRSHVAVLKAIRDGRIERTPEGKIDCEDADRAWVANTRLERASSAAGPAREEGDGPDEGESATAGMTMLQAATIEKLWKAKQAELDYRTQLGQVVNALDVAARLANTFTMCRTKLLGIPTRARQSLPDLTPAQVASINNWIREGLEDLSNTTGVAVDEDADA